MIPKKFILVIVITILSPNIYGQVYISVFGNPTFPSSHFFLSEAGNDFGNSVTSSSGSTISIATNNWWLNFTGSFNWYTTVYKFDTNWDSNLELEVRRSGSGTGGSLRKNKITGGTNFTRVNNMPSNFFSGRAVRNDVPIEYRINGISVLIPADDYETTIYYTVYQQ
jgi:hypothetical protein